MSLRNGGDNGGGGNGGNGSGGGGGFGGSSVWAPTSVSGGWSSEVAPGSNAAAGDAASLKLDDSGKNAWGQLDGTIGTDSAAAEAIQQQQQQQPPRSAGAGSGSAWGGEWDASGVISPTTDAAKSIANATSSSSTAAAQPALSSPTGMWSSAGLGAASSIWGAGPQQPPPPAIQAGDSAAAATSPNTPGGSSVEAVWMSGGGGGSGSVAGGWKSGPASNQDDFSTQLRQQQQPPTVAPAGAPAASEDPSSTGGGPAMDAIVNSNDGWGSRPINQTTPWDLGAADAALAAASVRPGESLVWNQEPNNGTAIWETYYESRGERPGRWDRGQQPPPPSMDAFQSGGQPPWTGGWNSAEPDAEPWSGIGGGHQGAGLPHQMMPPHPKLHQQPHHHQQQPPPSLTGSQSHSSKPEMRATLIRQLVEYGFSREEATQALINNNMSLEAAVHELRGSSGGPPHQPPHRAVAAGGFPPGVGGGGGGGIRGGAPPPQMRDQIMRQLQAVVHRGMMAGPPPIQQQQQQQMPGQMPPSMQQQPDTKMIQQQLLLGQNQLAMLTAQQQKLALTMRQQGQMNPMYSQQVTQLQELVAKSNQLKSSMHQLTQQMRAMELGGGGGGLDGRALAPGMPHMGQQQPPQQSQSRFEAWSGGLRGDDQRGMGQQQQQASQLHASLSNPNLMGGPHPAFHRSMSEIAPGGGVNRGGGGAGGIPGVMDGIPEFVPGQPWGGGVTGVGGGGGGAAVGRDVDISIGGVGAGGGLFSVSHESLEHHLGGGSSRVRGGGGGGMWQQQQQPGLGQRCCLFMRQVSPQVNRDVLNKICNQQGRVHRLQMHPGNLWALVRFSSQDEAEKAQKNILSLANNLVLATDQEAERLVQIESGVVGGGGGGGAGVGGWGIGGSSSNWSDVDQM